MNKYSLLFFGLIFALIIGSIGYQLFGVHKKSTTQNKNVIIQKKLQNLDPLSIVAMRNKKYPGSEIKIQEDLGIVNNYHEYVVSYLSEGLKINALLTVPLDTVPINGWPIIIFNHGYIPPTVYRTTERYLAYMDAFARNGYVVIKPDYRGNGFSEGKPEGAYYSLAYATDVLNAIASIKKYPGVNVDKIGMWGHSMGGNIALRILVINKDIKAAVIWGGVVGSYNDLIHNWQRRVSYQPPANELALRNNYRSNLISKYGEPKTNPAFWNTIDPTYFLNDISAPVQLHAGSEDEAVPILFSQNLYDSMKKIGKKIEFFTYPGADHNISEPNFDVAMKRSVDFFNNFLNK